MTLIGRRRDTPKSPTTGIIPCSTSQVRNGGSKGLNRLVNSPSHHLEDHYPILSILSMLLQMWSSDRPENDGPLSSPRSPSLPRTSCFRREVVERSSEKGCPPDARIFASMCNIQQCGSKTTWKFIRDLHHLCFTPPLKSMLAVGAPTATITA